MSISLKISELHGFTVAESSKQTVSRPNGLLSPLSRIIATFLVTAVAYSSSPGQIRSLTLDLKNDFIFYKSDHLAGSTRSRSYGQNYILSLNGYGLDPKLLSLSLQTSFTNFSSTNRFSEIERKFGSRNLGLYNVTATLFPTNGFPLTFMASRTDHINHTENSDLAKATRENTIVEENERWGLRWNIRKNSHYPNIDLNFDRNIRRRKNLNPIFTKESNDRFGIRLSNSNQSGTTQYAVNYQGQRWKNQTSSANLNGHELSLTATSRLNSQTPIAFNGTYQIRSNSTNRNIHFSARYKPGKNFENSLVFQNLQYRYTGQYASTRTSNSLNFQSNFPLAANIHFNAGALYTQSVYDAGLTRRHLDRIRANAQTAYNSRIQIAVIDASLGTTVGLEKFPGRKRGLTHQTTFGVGVRSLTLRRFQLSIRNDLSLSKNYALGNFFQNNVKFAGSSNLIPRTLMTVELSWNDSRYLDKSAISPRTVYAVGTTIDTRLTSTTSLTTRHLLTLAQSQYFEKILKSMVQIRQAGLIRNFDLTVRGERDYHSFAQLELLRIQGIIKYRWYAFTIGARYSLEKIGGLMTQTLRFNIERPFSVNFR